MSPKLKTHLKNESIFLLKLCPSDPVTDVRMTHDKPLEDYSSPLQLLVPMDTKRVKKYLSTGTV